MDELTRRQFLTTAVAAVSAALLASPFVVAAIVPPTGAVALTSPSLAAAIGWLEDYKRRCAVVGALADKHLLVTANDETELRVLPNGEASPETKAWLMNQSEFHAKFDEWRALRQQIAAANGAGYLDGRDGRLQSDCPYKPEQFDLYMAWHNQWYIGANDRRIYGR